MYISNNKVYINNKVLEIGDKLTIKCFGQVKTIEVNEIMIINKNVIIKSKKKLCTELICLNKVEIEEEKDNTKDIIYLGGTCAGYKWRDDIKGNYKFYNPLKYNWNNKTRKEEEYIRKISKYNIYVFTKDIKGYYAIASFIDDINQYPEKTYYCILYEGMEECKKISLKQIENLVSKKNIRKFKNIDEINNFLKSKEEVK